MNPDSSAIHTEAEALAMHMKSSREAHERLLALLSLSESMNPRDVALERFIVKHAFIIILDLGQPVERIRAAWDLVVSRGFETSFEEKTLCFIGSAYCLDHGRCDLAQEFLDEAADILETNRNDWDDELYMQELRILKGHVERLARIRSKTVK